MKRTLLSLLLASFMAFGCNAQPKRTVVHEPVRFEDFTERGLTSFITFLLTNEGLSNDTTLKQLAYLKWFLRWARNFRYHDMADFEYFRPKLANTKKKIIFLTIEEIKKLLAYEIPESKAYLQRTRDPEDERLLTLVLTEQGKRLREKAVSIPPAVAKCMGLTAEEFRTLYLLTYKALHNMEQNDDITE